MCGAFPAKLNIGLCDYYEINGMGRENEDDFRIAGLSLEQK